jgi:DNA invertase Pin-like site-specific DNA recombinase
VSPKEKPTKPICVYTRVSEQGRRSDEELLSHDLQRTKIESYLASKEMVVAEERFEDTDQSGRKMSRPAFDRAIEGVRLQKYGGIAVARLSRFGRKTSGILELIYELEERGAAVIVLDPPIDTSTAAGRAMLTVFSAFVTMEAEQAVEQAGLVAEKKLKDGEALGGTAPVGYSFEVIGQDSNGKDRSGWLVPNDDAPAVLEAFEEFGSGASLGQVADLLNAAGVLTSRGNPWKITSVRAFLGRKVYTGVRVHGETRIEGAHDAIVPAALWRKVQKRLAPKEGHVTRTKGEGHVLGEGLIRCEVCGGGMVVGNANGKYRTLRCMARGGGHPVITYDKALEWIMLEAVRYIGWMKPVEDTSEVAAAEARLAAAREDLTDVEALLGTAAPMQSAQARAVVEAEDALDALDRPDGAVINIDRFLTPAGVKQHIEGLPVPEQRRALRSVIEKVVLSKTKGEARDRLTVYFTDGSVSPSPKSDWPVPSMGEMEASDDLFWQHGNGGLQTSPPAPARLSDQLRLRTGRPRGARG